MTLQIREVEYPVSLIGAAECFIPDGREFALLDVVSRCDALGRTGASTHSILCHAPRAVLEQPWRGPARLSCDERVLCEYRSGWELLRSLRSRRQTTTPGWLPLAPGWIGFIGYEMNCLLERLPEPRECVVPMPAARLALFDRAIVFDHERRLAFAVETSHDALGIARSKNALRLEEYVERWNVAVRDAHGKHGIIRRNPAGRVNIEYPVAREAFERRVARVKDYIAAGDVYQVNISHPILLRGLPGVFELAERVRAGNPAGFSAVLSWGECCVVSASPELFLHCSDGYVTTRPIKGTARRSADEILDRAARTALLASEKDHAELAMIVDLHRNDLGRVCEAGSIRVEQPRILEEHPSVFHTVASITGRLRTDRSIIDLLAGCFPPGSVTGAPKIRAMEIIHELESVARGVYCGTILGLVSDDTVWANVAIRTMQVFMNNGVMHVGGGVVADSDPAAEYDETLAKAQGILRAIRPVSSLASVSSAPLHYTEREQSEQRLA